MRLMTNLNLLLVSILAASFQTVTLKNDKQGLTFTVLFQNSTIAFYAVGVWSVELPARGSHGYQQLTWSHRVDNIERKEKITEESASQNHI